MTNERALVDLFHDALDAEDVSGPFQRLQLELDRSTGAPQRRTRRTFMTRQRIALLAAALVIVVIAGVLVSTRISTLHRTSGVPAGHAGIDQAAVAQLLARPLKFHQLAAGETCPPDGPFTQELFGAGPVYGQGGNVNATSVWGAYAQEYVITPPGLPGPLVLRALDLLNGQPGVFIDSYAAGPVYGTDTVSGKKVNQYTAAALDIDHSPKASYDFAPDAASGTHSFVQWYLEQGWPHNSGFCAGLQIDGPTFTEVLYATVSSA